jgi:hypothetical protein
VYKPGGIPHFVRNDNSKNWLAKLPSPILYGIVAETSAENVLSVPAESTEVTT